MLGKFNLRRIVLDVVKPAVEPSLVSIAEAIAGVRGVENVNLKVEEVDAKTEGLLVSRGPENGLRRFEQGNHRLWRGNTQRRPSCGRGETD